MKRLLCLFLALALGLSLCGCKNKNSNPELAGDPADETGEQIGVQLFSPSEDTPATAPPTPDTRPYHRVEITPDNWDLYFQLREIPLYSISNGEVISQICQNYCVVLRDEYLDRVISDGDYRVEFSFTFDVLYNTLDVDTKNYRYGHTSDFGYPDAPVYGQEGGGGHSNSPLVEASTTKPAVYDCFALEYSAYGTDYSRYHGYSNAFYTGWANINVESKVWSGVYIDLDRVTVESVSGYLDMAD